jgi:ABC-type glycerol-3-phosphate transport system substrate-binding protein
MRMQHLFTAVLLAVTVAAAAAPKTIAPATIPHPIAMYLQGLSKDGKETVTFRASASGTHFFLEEPSGVTVYVYDESVGYKKEAFLKGSTLAKAMKKYR